MELCWRRRAVPQPHRRRSRARSTLRRLCPRVYQRICVGIIVSYLWSNYDASIGGTARYDASIGGATQYSPWAIPSLLALRQRLDEAPAPTSVPSPPLKVRDFLFAHSHLPPPTHPQPSPTSPASPSPPTTSISLPVTPPTYTPHCPQPTSPAPSPTSQPT